MLDLWKKQFNKKTFYMKHDEPHIFFKSQWQISEEPSIFYLLFRWTITIYLLISWVLTVIDPEHLDEGVEFRVKWLIYLTNWGYTMCMLQSLICTIALTGWFIYAKKTKDTNILESSWTKRTYQIYWVTFIIAADLAFGITALYWPLIYNPQYNELDALNLFAHAINSIVMFIELCMVKLKVSILHVYWPTTFGFIYIIFSIIYYAAGGTSRIDDPYIYTLLDWRSPGRTIGICFGVLAFIIFLHLAVCSITNLRTYTHKQLCRKQANTDNVKIGETECYTNAIESDNPV